MEVMAELEAYLARLLGTLEDLCYKNSPVGGEAVSLPACKAEGQHLLSEAGVALRLSEDQNKVLRRRVLNLSADLSELQKALGEAEAASSGLRAQVATLGKENSRLRSRLEKLGPKAGVDAGDCERRAAETHLRRGARAPEDVIGDKRNPRGRETRTKPGRAFRSAPEFRADGDPAKTRPTPLQVHAEEPEEEPPLDLSTGERLGKLEEELKAYREENRQLRARLGTRDEALQVLVKELTRIEGILA